MAATAITIALLAPFLLIMKLLLQKQHQPSNNSGSRCVVCLSDLTRGDKIQQLSKCLHCFHTRCIDAWFQSSPSPTCPLCRTHAPVNFASQKQQNNSLLCVISAAVVSIADAMFSKVGSVSNFEESFKYSEDYMYLY